MILTLVYNIAEFLAGSAQNASMIMSISVLVAVVLYAVIYFKFGTSELLAQYVQNINYVGSIIAVDIIAFMVSKYFWAKLYASADISAKNIVETLENGVHPTAAICDPLTGNCYLPEQVSTPTELEQTPTNLSDAQTNVYNDAQINSQTPHIYTEDGFDMTKGNQIANEIQMDLITPQ
jgi:hypothetical protein